MAAVLNRDAREAARAGHVGSGSVGGRELAGGLVRLKWTLWKRSYRKNVGKLVGTIIGVLYGAGALVGATAALVALVIADGDGTFLPPFVRGLGVAATLLWLLLPLLAFGVDDTLDPRAFAVHPRSPRELQPGMFAAAALSLPSVFMVLAVLLCTVFEAIWLVLHGAGALWTALGLLALLPANLAGTALCLLLPRAILAHAAGRPSSRRGRELGSIIGMVALLAGLYAFSLLVQTVDGAGAQRLLPALIRLVDVLSWTPLGALFSVPIDLGAGAPIAAGLRAAAGAASIVLLWRWWRSSLGAALTSALVGEPSSAAAGERPLVPRGAPATALGASIGRSLRYWRRDSRYLAAVAVMPLMLVFFVAMGMIGAGGPTMGILGLVLVAGLGGVSLMNEIGFDGPAGWVHLTTAAPSRANLGGRVIALALFAVPFVAVSAVVVPLISGQGQLVAMLLPGCLGLLLSGLGVSILISVLLPYPTSPPGTNPMKDRSGSSANAMIAMSVGMIGVWIPQVPALALGIWGTVAGSAGLRLAGGMLALVVGVVVVVVGVRLAASILDRRAVDLFQKVRQHV